MSVRRAILLFQEFLEHRYLPAALAVLAMVFSIPALWSGWGPMDDLRHRAKLLSPSESAERLTSTGLVPENPGELSTVLSDMHTIARSADDFDMLSNYGVLPWWTQQNYRASNWRPLDSFTHWLDYRLFPDCSALIHLHNLLWFAAVILLVTLLYRRLTGPAWVAGLAALMYLLDDINYLPAMWIANRHLLISLVLTVSTLLAYHKWRTTGSLLAAVTAHLCLFCSLLVSEGSVAIFAYLFAYAVFLDHGNWTRRALSLVPAVLIIVLWRIIYSSLDNGAYGSGFVIDPIREPLHYVSAVFGRGPLLLFALLGGPPAETFTFIRDNLRLPYWFAAVGYLFLMFVVLWPLLRSSKQARFWLTAMILSVLPICATLPMNRNLLFAAIGGFGLIARFIYFIAAEFGRQNRPRLWRYCAWVFCVFLLLAHVLFAVVGRIVTPKMVEFVHGEFHSTIRLGELQGVENQDLIVVNAPNPFSLFFLPTYRVHYGQPLPRAIRALSPGFGPLEVIRESENRLLLRAKWGNLLCCEQKHPFHFVYLYRDFNVGFRDRRFPMHMGERVVLPRLTIEVKEVDTDNLPTTVLVSFETPLEDSSLRWLVWNWDRKCYEPFVLPRPGEKVTIKGPF